MKTAKLGRPVELPGAWGEMAHEAGGTTALAERLGKGSRTVQRWAKGEHAPSKADWFLIAAVAKELGVTPPRASQRAA